LIITTSILQLKKPIFFLKLMKYTRTAVSIQIVMIEEWDVVWYYSSLFFF